MSTEFTPITTSMLHEYLGSKAGDAGRYRALALLAEVLNGEYNLDDLHREILEVTQP